jgi:uncharacterized protein YegL
MAGKGRYLFNCLRVHSPTASRSQVARCRGSERLILAALILIVSIFRLPEALSAPGQPKPGEKMIQLTLHAGVFAKLLEAGLDCVPEGKQALPALVNSVKFHSQAETEGMREGDRILAVSVHPDDSLDLTFERGGSKYSLRLDTYPEWGRGWTNKGAQETASEKQAQPVDRPTEKPAENVAIAPEPLLANVTPSMNPNYPDQTPQTSIPENDPINLSVAEQQKILAEHQVVIMIDRSGSMNTRDCPQGFSRWEWCRQQTTELSKESEDYLPEGLTLVVFSTDFEVYQHAHVKEIAEVFQNFSPEGSTNTGSALWDRLRAYLNEKAKNPKLTKPLLIAVITDGEPTDGRTTADAIINATSKMTNPADISITFLQVGNGAAGSALLDELADKLVDEGARYDIAQHETFARLLRTGLRTALVSAIVAPHVKPQQDGNNTAHSDSFFRRLGASLEKKWLKHQPKNSF